MNNVIRYEQERLIDWAYEDYGPAAQRGTQLVRAVEAAANSALAIETNSGQMLAELDNLFQGQLLTNELLERNSQIAVQTNAHLAEVNRVLLLVHSQNARQAEFDKGLLKITNEQLATQLRLERLYLTELASLQREREVKQLLYEQTRLLASTEAAGDPVSTAYVSRVLIELIQEKHGFSTKDLFDLADKRAFDELMDRARRQRDQLDATLNQQLLDFLRTYAVHLELLGTPLPHQQPKLTLLIEMQPLPPVVAVAHPGDRPAPPNTRKGPLSEDDEQLVRQLLTTVQSESRPTVAFPTAESTGRRREAILLGAACLACAAAAITMALVGGAGFIWAVIFAIPTVIFAVRCVRSLSRAVEIEDRWQAAHDQSEQLRAEGWNVLTEHYGFESADAASQALADYEQYVKDAGEYDQAFSRFQQASEAADRREQIRRANEMTQQVNHAIERANEVLLMEAGNVFDERSRKKSDLLARFRHDINAFLGVHQPMTQFFPTV